MHDNGTGISDAIIERRDDDGLTRYHDDEDTNQT